MRYLAIIVWLILGILYWWVWDSSSNDCCGTDGISNTKTEEVVGEATAMDDAKRIEAEKAAQLKKEEANKEAEETAAKEAVKAIEEAEKSNEVTAVKSTNASGARKLTFYFPYNSPNAKYSASTEKDLRDLIAYAKSSGKKITITGHTDSRGDPQSNMTLGQQRADQIKNKLISGGLASQQVAARSQGQNAPVASNATSSGRQQNRRVELIIE